MSVKPDWFPSDRTGQLEMARNWEAVLAERWSAWDIPAPAVQDLSECAAEAGSALALSRSEEARRAVVNVRVRQVFRSLEAVMYALERHFFHIPPLTEADINSLGITVQDRHHRGAPSAQVQAEPFPAGLCELGLHIVYVSGDPAGPDGEGFRVYYNIVEPGAPAPVNPEQIGESFFTRRKKDVLGLPSGSSGKTVYFCVQIENNGLKGPFGPITSALVP